LKKIVKTLERLKEIYLRPKSSKKSDYYFSEISLFRDLNSLLKFSGSALNLA